MFLSMKLIIIFYCCISYSLISCTTSKPIVNESLLENNSNSIIKNNTIYNVAVKHVKDIEIDKQKITVLVDDSTFVNLKDYSNGFFYDLKYATTDNFLKSKVYDCGECYLRYKTVKALIEANNYFINKGLRIKLFDCYRPLDVQKKMWDIVSNPQYVADPKKGSIHNRGGAIDLTLVDINGKELDMGTTFDFFGIESNHTYENLSVEIKRNRKLLRDGMMRFNFRIFEGEWWHYNFKNSNKYLLSNFKWNCE